MKKLLVLIALCALVGTLAYPDVEVQHPPGILLADIPFQQNLHERRLWKKDEYVFSALATFELEARVLSAAHYWFDASAALSPVDLALGWGIMSDSAVLDELRITQSGRFYYWRMEGNPAASIQEISQNSANMHLIPANDDIENALKDVQKGDLIWLQGYLVDVRSASGFRWRSSLTRNDTGAGACEVIWVEAIEWIELE